MWRAFHTADTSLLDRNSNQFKRVEMKKGKWWALSNSISLMFLTLTGVMWIYTTTRYSPNINQLTNQKQVDKYLTKNFPDLPPKRIPTGAFVQSFKFVNSTEVNFSGYIWQIYDRSTYENIPGSQIPVGFILPETVGGSDNIKPTFAYRRVEGDREVIGWFFEATLKQKFDYSKYPFDHKMAWIRIWSADFGQGTLLIPDFSAYSSTDLGDAFGYDKDIVLGQWSLLETFFDYQSQAYNSNFGIPEREILNPYPELYFNLVIKRRFLNSFVVYILPLAIIACLTFATLMMVTKNPDRSSAFGMNTSGVVGVCSGLFFIVLLSQVQIREQFAGASVVYVEYFYPVMYVTFLCVSVNSYLFSLPNTTNNRILSWVSYEDNVRPKLLYWPLLLGSIVAITALVLLPKGEERPLLDRDLDPTSKAIDTSPNSDVKRLPNTNSFSLCYRSSGLRNPSNTRL